MPPTTEIRTALSERSYVSAGLVLALLGGALFYGRQLERLDRIEQTLTELSAEVRELRRDVRQPIIGR